MGEEEGKISEDVSCKEGASKDMEGMEKSLEDALKKNEEYLSMLQRLQADFENYKKRMVREREELVKIAESELVLQQLGILDNFEIALAHEKNEVLFMLYSQFRKILADKGLEEIVNETFDPYYHEAVAVDSCQDKPEGAIVEVAQKGYIFKGKVIRHSRVVVNRLAQSNESVEP